MSKDADDRPVVRRRAVRRGESLVTDRGVESNDQLPWLQGVEDEQQPRGLSARKMFLALLFVAAAVAATAATFFWLGQRDSGGEGMPQLIAAPPGPYKVKPSDPGGLDVS